MESTKDPREALMWEDNLLVSSEQLKAYAANYAPLGVYIPRGRVKVPHTRSRRIQQLVQSTRGKNNTPHILMIRPEPHPLPPISLYGARDVTMGVNRNNGPATSSRYVMNNVNRKNGAKLIDSMTSHLVHSNNGHKMTQRVKPLLHHQKTSLPPSYAESREDRMRHYIHSKLSAREPEMTSFMTQDISYPLGHQYYQHLSAIAAMAWSDCNHATEKLRRIYEETSHLSRSYGSFGFLSGGLPSNYPTQILSSSPALGNAASIFGAKDSALPQTHHHDLLAARYHRLAEDHQKYINQQSSSSGVINYQPINYGDITYNKERMTMTSQNGTSQNNHQYNVPKEPLPGIALFDSRYKQPGLQMNYDMIKPEYNVVKQNYDVVKQNYEETKSNYDVTEQQIQRSRQKRKLCEQTEYITDTRTKIPRRDFKKYMMNNDLTIASQSIDSLLPEVFKQRAPPYDIVDIANGSSYANMPDIVKRTAAPNLDISEVFNIPDVIKKDKIDDVTSLAFPENLKYCLPSVSRSPTPQLFANNGISRNVPYVMQ